MIITLYSRDANPSMKREVLRVFTLRLVRGLGQSTPAVAGTLPAPKDHVQLEARPAVGLSKWLYHGNFLSLRQTSRSRRPWATGVFWRLLFFAPCALLFLRHYQRALQALANCLRKCNGTFPDKLI